MAYAERTKVAPEKTKTEIEQTLRRYGADAFMSGWGEGKAWVQFRAKGRIIKFVIPLPDRKKAGAEQEERRRWRSLLLVIKSKLEAVDSGIEEFDTAFLAHIVLPNGQTVGQWIRPQVQVVYEKGEMPKMLPDYSRG